VNTILLEEISCTLDEGLIRVSCSVNAVGLPDILWFEIKGLSGYDSLTLSYNWAVVALLFPAMQRGDNIIVKGCVSERLHTNINNDLQLLLQVFQPSLRKIQVKPDTVTKEKILNTGRVGTGFSAGVDSFATLQHFSEENASTSIEVTDICTFNVGAMGRYENPDVETVYDDYCKRTARYAGISGKNAICVNSNVDSFYRGLNFQKTHTFSNISAALVLEGYFDCYLYASSFPFKDTAVKETYDCSYFDPVSLPMLSTENITFMSAMAGINRVDKTRLLVQSQAAMQMLNVCVASAETREKLIKPNCSVCWKCQRTLITLEALGIIDKFSSVFDLSVYKEEKCKFYRNLFFKMLDGDPLAKEAFYLAKKSGLKVQIRITDYIVGAGKKGLKSGNKTLKNIPFIKCFRLARKQRRLNKNF
jgi:hypothetical protein